MKTENTYKQGMKVSTNDSDFTEAMLAAVDYRGDTTIELKDGSVVDGYLFNMIGKELEIFPKDEPHKVNVAISEIETIHFSGIDTAEGKSWEAWVAKKKAEKQAKQTEANS